MEYKSRLLDLFPGQSRIANALAAPQSRPLPFGAERRTSLYPGEESYFAQNPSVAGMAADDDRVVMNPHSQNSLAGQNSVAVNEAARIAMRREGYTPAFQPTTQQRQTFQGTGYQNDEGALRSTLMARALAGDPSAGELTPDQRNYLISFMLRQNAAK